ncbi:MAG: OmpA family protein [Thermodesulfobacteriota bacterium]
MKSFLYLFFFIIFFCPNISVAKNFIVHLDDNSKIISNEFNYSLLDKEKDNYNPYVRVSDLNISVIKFTSEKDNEVYHISENEMSTKLDEIVFYEEIKGNKNSYNLNLKYSEGESVQTTDAGLFRYIGNKTPSKKISVLRYDEYNDTWIPEYIDISKIEKIVFKHRKKPESDDKDTEEDDQEKEDEKSGYKKKVLFSSDNFTNDSFAKNLKSSLLNLKKGSDDFSSTIVLRVHFDFDSSKLNSKATQFLNIIGDVISSPELYGIQFNLRGFTDSTGEDDYNMRLSKKRAESVKNYLQNNKNISSQRLKTSGYGEQMPVLPNTSDYYKSLNRRVEIYPVYYMN